MIPFRDPFEWQESYGRYLLNIRTGGYCTFDYQATNGLHSHDFYEVCLITEGKGQYSYDGSDHDLAAGDVILALPNTPHEIYSWKTRDLQLVFFAFDIHAGPMETISGEKEILISNIIHSAQIHSHNHRRLLGYLQILGRDLESNWTLERTLASFFAELLNTLAPHSSGERGSDEKNYVARAIDYIDMNIRKPVSVQDIARAVGLSERSLRRYFSHILKKTIVEVIRERKLNRAATLLLMNFDVSSVSRSMALEPSHFSRIFKTQFGVSPRNYQKAYQGKSTQSKRTVHQLPRD